mmetsp:Transcript_27120/g.76589  ORF Transcript_27120/g.76589 Transcript_27120/m.76589 type:complete len:704 (-) Transcript_27120:175-2286(-)
MKMRVAIIAEDDSVADCLYPFIARECEVLGVTAGGAHCPFFAKRCVESGFAFVASKDSSVSSRVVEDFKPELVVCVFVTDSHVPADLLGATGSSRKCLVRVGAPSAEGLWPEFGVIWTSQQTSPVKLVEFGTNAELAASSVDVGADETALSLRVKHAAAASALLLSLLDGALPAAAAPRCADGPAGVQDAAAHPQSISLDWDSDTVDRYVRARFFPPHDPAVVEDPSTGEGYFVENMAQYREFQRSMCQQGAASAAQGAAGGYAADTHWYSNIGGSIVKMTDSAIHKPVRVADKKRAALVPGAAINARKKLRMNEPLIGPNAEHYCSNALTSGWIGVEGPYVKRFEKHLAQICGCAAACAVQSGTAALYGAMKALGVSDRMHHVLCPSFTCAACADAVVHAGGTPIPVDCELESYGVSLEAARRALEANKNVVGIIVAPCYGTPARDFHPVLALCNEYGIWLCEDAAESYGATKCAAAQKGGEGKAPVGALATLCTISVRSEKMIGVGEGGAILGNDAMLVARARWWCSRAPCRGVGLWRVYEHDAVGQNFRIPEMLAAVGCAAAEVFPVMIERKRAIHDWYEAGMAARPALHGVRIQKEMPGDESVWWLNCALLPEGMSGEEVGMKLMELYPDIEIRPGFFPLNKMGIFASPFAQPCPNAEELYKRLICLPSSNQLGEQDVDRVCSALVGAIGAVAGAAAEQ